MDSRRLIYALVIAVVLIVAVAWFFIVAWAPRTVYD
jgi:hypothetical protein